MLGSIAEMADRHNRRGPKTRYILWPMCLSVRPSLRLTQVLILPKKLNVGSRKQCHMTAQGI